MNTVYLSLLAKNATFDTQERQKRFVFVLKQAVQILLQ